MAADRPIKAHQSPLFLFVQASKGILVSSENHTGKCCKLPKSSGKRQLCLFSKSIKKKKKKTHLRKPVHVDKQAGGRVPDLF